MYTDTVWSMAYRVDVQTDYWAFYQLENYFNINKSEIIQLYGTICVNLLMEVQIPELVIYSFISGTQFLSEAFRTASKLAYCHF